MKILLNGMSGFMGNEVVKLCEAACRGASLAYGVDPGAKADNITIFNSIDDIPTDINTDCIIDFSVHTCTPALLEFAVCRKLPIVIATTGHTKDELALIDKASKEIPVFFSANMSLGVALLVELAKATAQAMPEADIEIVETHHNRKIDAPSGTALMIANELCNVRTEAFIKSGRAGQAKRELNEIGIHAVRHGNIVGIHEVIVGTQSQTITLKHEAHSRALFAEGAIAAADFLIRKPSGLYNMKSIVSE